jgi:hypothetical protein
MSPERSDRKHNPENDLNQIFRFPNGTEIFIEGEENVRLHGDAYGKMTSETIKGFTAYIATSQLALRHGVRYWTLPEGTIFGAYANKAQKIISHER